MYLWKINFIKTMIPLCKKLIFSAIVFFILLSGICKSDNNFYNTYFFVADSISDSTRLKGYTDVAVFRDQFIAIGADGRIDNILKSGKQITIDNSNAHPLNCIFADEKTILIGGDNGQILYSSDGKNFSLVESTTDKNIFDMTAKKGLIVAGAENGTILTTNDGISWKINPTEIKGNILSISANNTFFIGITDAGEIIKSNDGDKWEILDYNKEYAGYNPYTKFKKILATQNSIVIIGTHDDGSPSILVSTLGNVWAERIPFYIDDQGMDSYLTNTPNDIIYNEKLDLFILACDQGVLFTLPTCNKCNEYLKISRSNLNAIASSQNLLLIVDDEFSVYFQN